MTFWWRRAGAAGGVAVLAVLVGCATPPSLVVEPVRMESNLPPVAVQALPTEPDPEPHVEPIAAAGPNLPYTVHGQTYAPLLADVPWTQRGLASWYGKNFNGRRTASGERFRATSLTAAHRTLPIPSYARVRHIASGKEVIVRVNDRGPFHSARVLDLSYAAAQQLGMVGQGSAEVEIERLTFDEIRTGTWRRGEPSTPVP